MSQAIEIEEIGIKLENLDPQSVCLQDQIYFLQVPKAKIAYNEHDVQNFPVEAWIGAFSNIRNGIKPGLLNRDANSTLESLSKSLNTIKAGMNKVKFNKNDIPQVKADLVGVIEVFYKHLISAFQTQGELFKKILNNAIHKKIDEIKKKQSDVKESSQSQKPLGGDCACNSKL